MTSLLPAFILVTTAVIVGSSFIGLFLWRKRRREGRFPLGEDVLLLRGAGEGLRRRLETLEEKMLSSYLAAMLLPLLLGLFPLLLIQWLGSQTWAPGIIIASLALAATGVIIGVSFMVRITEQIRDTRLGIFGERIVADQLEDLKSRGFVIFHDLPCAGAAGPFNIDHIAVGNGAVAVIETKTRRKPRDVSGGHRVRCEGRKLIWPKFESEAEVGQVLSQKEWLSDRLREKLGIKADIHTFIVIPGWFVQCGSGVPVHACNHKGIVGAVDHLCRGSLSPQHQDALIRHFRDACQTVTFSEV